METGPKGGCGTAAPAGRVAATGQPSPSRNRLFRRSIHGKRPLTKRAFPHFYRLLTVRGVAGA
jgi:hypothetical protein